MTYHGSHLGKAVIYRRVRTSFEAKRIIAAMEALGLAVEVEARGAWYTAAPQLWMFRNRPIVKIARDWAYILDDDGATYKVQPDEDDEDAFFAITGYEEYQA